MLAASCSATLRVAPAQPGRRFRHAGQRPAARQPARQPIRAFKEGSQSHGHASNGAAASLEASPDHLRATKMVNLMLEYFNELMSNGNTEICHKILAPGVQHKDMVRNEGRFGIPDYERYVRELKSTYPDIYVKPTQFGLVDDHTMFVAFEGQAARDTPLFKGVDMFKFTHDASKIREIEVYRSNWLGAQGHEERKKKAAQAGRGH